MEKERSSDLVKEFYSLTETHQHKREISFIAEIYKANELKRKKSLKFVSKFEKLNKLDFETLQKAYWDCVNDINRKQKNYEGIVTKFENQCFSTIKRFSRLKLYRSFWIKNFCVDFFIPRFGAVLEVDGGIHFNETKMRKDEFKENYLKDRFKISVWRAANKDVEMFVYMALTQIRGDGELSSKALKKLMSKIFIETIVFHSSHDELVRIVGEDFYIGIAEFFKLNRQQKNLDKESKIDYNNSQRSLTIEYIRRQLNPRPS